MTIDKGKLVEKIKERKARIAVVGLGHVGLPTAAIFADAGFDVIGTDVKMEIVEAVLSEKSLVKEPRLGDLVKKAVTNGKLKAMTDTGLAVKKADIAMVCVPTPLTENKKPDQTYLIKACEDVAKELSGGKLIVIQSTVSPGTNKSFVVRTLEKRSGLTCGRDFWLAYCPERIAPSRAVREFAENARIIGGYDSESAEIAAELFKTVMEGEILVTDYNSAEVAKLAENTFRYVNIAFANELALICEHLGVDVVEVVRLANTHPRVNILKAGPGVGGPCLPKDPQLLFYPVKQLGFKSRVIETSEKVNDYMPGHVVEMVVKALNKVSKDVESSQVTVLGVAYKGGVNDVRNSPAKGIIGKLLDSGAKVVVYDPYCEENFGAKKARNIVDAVEGSDCLLMVTDHEMFRGLELGRLRALMNANPVIVDGRRLIDSVKAREEGFVYSGIGYGV